MSPLENKNNLSRRKFLGLVGGTALGAFIFEACGVPEQEFIIQAPVDMPEDYVKGEDDWYATLSDTSSHGESLIVRIMQGRAKKIEGNPDFPMCGFSSVATTILKKCGVEFGYCNVLDDNNIREGIKAFSNWPTIPQLYIKKEFIGGCDIMKEMAESGELVELFNTRGVKTEIK